MLFRKTTAYIVSNNLLNLFGLKTGILTCNTASNVVLVFLTPEFNFVKFAVNVL